MDNRIVILALLVGIGCSAEATVSLHRSAPEPTMTSSRGVKPQPVEILLATRLF